MSISMITLLADTTITTKYPIGSIWKLHWEYSSARVDPPVKVEGYVPTIKGSTVFIRLSQQGKLLPGYYLPNQLRPLPGVSP